MLGLESGTAHMSRLQLLAKLKSNSDVEPMETAGNPGKKFSGERVIGTYLAAKRRAQKNCGPLDMLTTNSRHCCVVKSQSTGSLHCCKQIFGKSEQIFLRTFCADFLISNLEQMT